MVKLILSAGVVLFTASLNAQAIHKSKGSSSHEKMLLWKPTKKASFNWDNGTSSFNFSDSTYYAYETSEELPENQLIRANGQDIAVTHRDWDANGNLILEYYAQFNGSTMDTVYKEVATYDNYSNELTNKRYTNSGGTLVLLDNNNRIYNNTLNAQNNPTLTIIQTYNTATLQYEDYARITSDYTSNGQMLMYSEESWDGSEWIKDFKAEMTLNGNEQIVSFIESISDGQNNWENSGRMSALILENPAASFMDMVLLAYTYEEYNTGTSIFELSERFSITVNGNETTELVEAYDNSTWVFDQSNYSKNDAYGNRLKTLNTYINGDELLDVSCYDVYEYILDGNNRPMEEIKTDSLYNNKYKYIYSDYVQLDIEVASIVDAPKFEFNVYPNPSNGVFYIQDANVASLQVFDLNGQLILNTKENTIDLGTVQQGIYLVKLTDTSGREAIQRIVKK